MSRVLKQVASPERRTREISATEIPRTWLLLAFQLPTQEAYQRVKIWRRLQSLGAVSFRNSLYVLPAGDATLEDFEWVLREVREAGGDGALFEAQPTASSSDHTLCALFSDAREADYEVLAEELRAAGAAKPSGANAEPAENSQLIARIRRRLREIEAIDFFNANGRETVHALLRSLEADSPPARSDSLMSPSKSLDDLRGRTWVTRAQVRVDRMASAWLIRRQIDPGAQFRFVVERGYRPAGDELRFDMYEAEYTHDADRCTFEVLLALNPEQDAALTAIAEIVHDLDIKDHKFDRPESAGVRQLLEGIIAGTSDDEERLKRSAVLFDDLYRSFAKSCP